MNVFNGQICRAKDNKLVLGDNGPVIALPFKLLLHF